ncbi:MAG: hydroxyneurosporene dehydrogenase [Clostridia bacterium]|nr:hydroxyneurosporene dehydrogenase [Clostridia bacterium]
MKKVKKSIHPDDDRHYESMGLMRDRVEPWEDGSRVDGSKGCYEWWYFDSHYPDGTVLVLFFFSKMPIDVNGPIKPIATAELTLPDGTKFSEEVYASMEESHYAKDKCDVKIGTCYCRGDLEHYDVLFRGERMTARFTLDGTIKAWRSQTGSIFFGDREEHYFAWLPAVPEGKAVAELTYDGGKTLHLEGSGYHDHNWGNISMLKLMHHWYWGRAKIGDYKVISSWITSEKKYGYKEHDVFMIAKNGEILGDNANHTLKFMPEDRYIDPYTKKPVYNRVIYEYLTDTNETYRITYQRQGDINKTRFVDVLPAPLGLLASLIGFDGGYLRFEGRATVEKLEGGKVVECVSDPAVWELMYFGKACADETYRKNGKKTKERKKA